MVAVVHSILNRVNNPKWWGNSVSSVIAKKWQYSSMTDPNDPQLTKFPVQPDESFSQALLAVADVLDNEVPNPAPRADSYYDDSIPPPKWATPDKLVGKIGRLTFYNIDQDTGD